MFWGEINPRQLAWRAADGRQFVTASHHSGRGSFRFHAEFGLAVDFINRRRVDLSPLISGGYPVEDAVAAFEAATDRSRSMKVHLPFAPA